MSTTLTLLFMRAYKHQFIYLLEMLKRVLTSTGIFLQDQWLLGTYNNNAHTE
jgi:hypothetical protein